MRAITTIFLLLFISTTYAGGDPYNVVTVNGKKGLKDSGGHFVISPKYDEIGWTDGSSMPVNGIIGYQESGRWGLINIRNEKLTSSKYTHLLPFQGAMFVASIKGKFSHRAFYGLISERGKPIIDFKFYALKSMNGYLVALSKTNNEFVYGLVNAQGQTILGFEYKSIELVSDHLIKAELGENKYHLFNSTTGILLEGVYSSVKPIDEDHSLIQMERQVGVLSHQGRILIAPAYQEIVKSVDNEWKGKKFTTWSVLDNNNEVVNEVYGQSIKMLEDHLIIETTIGDELVDKNFKSLTPEPFDKIVKMNGSNVLFKKNEQYGVYDLGKQQYLKGVRFDTAFIAGEFIYGGRKFHHSMKWALYDTFGVKRTHFDYELIKEQKNRLFSVKRKSHWGFMNRNGKEVIHCVYDSIGEFNENLVVVLYHGLHGVINKKNEWVVLPQKGKITLINSKLYLSRIDGTTELRSISGELIYFTKNSIELLNGVLVENLSDGQQQIVSLDGVFINRYKNGASAYQQMKYLEDEMIAVKMNGKFGFVDKQDRLRITNRYDDVGHYNERGIPIKLLGKWGMINIEEQITVQPLYDSILPPVNGVSIVVLQNLKGLIDFEGNELLAPRFDEIIPQENGEYLISLRGKYGLVGEDGRELVNVKYDELHRLNNDVIIVKKRELYGTITLNGIELVPNIYDEILYQENWQTYLAKKEGDWESIQIQQ